MPMSVIVVGQVSAVTPVLAPVFSNALSPMVVAALMDRLVMPFAP